MAKTSRRSNNKSNPNRSLFIVVGLFIALLIYATLFFQDYREVKFSFFITFVYIIAAGAAFLFTLIGIAQHILPYQAGDSWFDGLSILWKSIGNSFTIEKELPTVGIEEEELDRSFARLDAGILRSHQVLAIYKGNSFSRPSGPGFVRLFSGEVIDEVVDLRPHSRSHPIEVHTRDGIPVTSSASVRFQVRRPDHNPDDTREYTYDRAAIFEVSHSSSIKIDDHILSWSDQVAPQAASYGVSEIAQYTLAELPRHLGEINKSIQRDLQITFQDYGIEILGASVGSPQPPKEIQNQHLHNWQAEWQRRTIIKEAANQAEATRRMENARARAQVEIIQTIMQSIDDMRHSGQTDLTNIITLRMIEVLEHAMDTQIVDGPKVHLMLQDTSKQLKALIEQPDDEGEL